MVTRYDLTEEVVTGRIDVTPVPESHEGRYVSYEDYEKLRETLMDYMVVKEKEIRSLAKAILEAPCDPATEEFAKQVLEND